MLGYIQRGGIPSVSDRILAARLGNRAVELLRDNRSGLCVSVRHNDVIEIPIADTKGMKRPMNVEYKELVNTLSS